MKVEVFDGGDGYMRKDDHQFFQPMYIRSSAPLDPGAEVRRGGHGLGLEAGRRSSRRTTPCADDLQDGAAVRIVPARSAGAFARHEREAAASVSRTGRRLDAATHHLLDAERRALRHAAVHAGERPDARSSA